MSIEDTIKIIRSGLDPNGETANAIIAALQRLEKLEAVAKAAEDFMNSDGDYFAWTEDERHCMSRLRDAVLALKEEV